MAHTDGRADGSRIPDARRRGGAMNTAGALHNGARADETDARYEPLNNPRLRVGGIPSQSVPEQDVAAAGDAYERMISPSASGSTRSRS